MASPGIGRPDWLLRLAAGTMMSRAQPDVASTGIRRLSLRFAQPDVEAEFHRAYVRRCLTQTRIALLLALALYASFGMTDPFVIPRTTQFAWTLRYGIGCPLLLLTLALSFSRTVERWMHGALVGLGLVIGFSIVAMTWKDGSASGHQYYAGLMLVSVYLYAFVRLRFLPATLTCWSFLVVYEVVAVSSGVVPAAVLVNNSIFMLSINVIGMSVCYSREWSNRVEFMQRRLIDRQAQELRRTLAELETKNAELDSFVYSVSHDLKAPLVTIEGLTEVLDADYGARLDDTGRHLLERVVASTRHMERLICDVLALSRIGREAQPRQWVDVDGLVSRLVADFAARHRPDVQVTRHPLPALWAMPAHVEQVFANLVGNAFKYLGDGPDPAVEIGAVDHDDTVEFHVRDSGIGIDPAYHAKVFEVFQRLQDAKTEGTGVGLAIVKRSVELNGGRIWIESRKGGGATFRFTWPKPAGEQPPDSR